MALPSPILRSFSVPVPLHVSGLFLIGLSIMQWPSVLTSQLLSVFLLPLRVSFCSDWIVHVSVSDSILITALPLWLQPWLLALLSSLKSLELPLVLPVLGAFGISSCYSFIY